MLEPGHRIGPYEIAAVIGSGGMGTVYRARDTRLDRPVALKFVKAEYTDRFDREARAISAVNHPNIATLYEVGVSDGQPYLVMELVEGQPLRGPLPVKDAIGVAVQIADAVAAAHAAGIVHRDLKPANILVGDRGTVKILDFGLAKAIAPEMGPDDRTQSVSAHTIEGTIIGTVAYMSPEQAEGKEVDPRSDIFSFGAVLYEVLTGAPAFRGETVVSTLSAVLRHEPPPIEGIPTDLGRLVERCLRKDRHRRLQHMDDVALLLREVDVHGTAAGAGSARRVPRWRRMAALASAGAIAATAFYLGTRTSTEPVAPLRKYRLQFEADAGSRGGYDTTRKPVISPDGARVAYTREGRVWIRELAQLEAREYPGTEDAVGPFWSPDSQFVAFAARGTVKKVAVTTGAVTNVAPLPTGSFTGGTWGSAGTILIASADLYEVQDTGGIFKRVLEADASVASDFHSPYYLPDGRAFLFVLHPSENSRFSIHVRRGETTRRLVDAADGVPASPVYDARGYLIYEYIRKGKTLLAAPFSLDTLTVTGDPVVVAEGAGGPSTALDGTLIYIEGGSAAGQVLAIVDRQGGVERESGEVFDQVLDPVTSPDGTRIAFAAARDGNHDIWVLDTGRWSVRKLTTTNWTDGQPAWSADGMRLAAVSDGRIVVMPSDGSGAPRAVTPAGRRFTGPSWLAERDTLVFQSLTTGDDAPELFTTSADADNAPAAIFSGAPGSFGFRVSPDGRFVAFGSASSGREEIYVRPFPQGEGLWQVSSNGGTLPTWVPGRGELVFLEGSTLMSATFQTVGGFAPGQPTRLFPGDAAGVLLYSFSNRVPAYSTLPGGQRFVAVRAAGGRVREGVVVVEHWRRQFDR